MLKGKCFNAQRVNHYPLFFELIHGFQSRVCAGSIIQHPHGCSFIINRYLRSRYQFPGGFPLLQQTLHVLLVSTTFFCIFRILIMGCATGKIGTFGRMSPGISPVTYTVTVYIQIPSPAVA